MSIKDNLARLLRELPAHVQLVAAAKTRTVEEIEQAIAGGAKIIGENYVQEAEKAFSVIGHKVKWHFIGHLQKNKVKKAVKIFDMIETVDSKSLAAEIDKISAQEKKLMPILIEINSAREKGKFGVLPEAAGELISQICGFAQIKVMGLMTMGPETANPEHARPYFQQTKKIFDAIAALNLPQVEMHYLSMGMTGSYQVAIEEGANLVRIGNKIFGARK